MKFKEITNKGIAEEKESIKVNYKWEIIWRNVIIFIYIHLATIYGIYLAFRYANLLTFMWFFSIGFVSGVGTTAGAHRLWCHRSYKAKWPLRLILITFQTIAFQNDIYDWVRDHRVHHKFTDTDADPYNARRGFFFSHIGWLMLRKHPDVIKKGAMIDMSDIVQDPLVVFQRKWYLYLAVLLSFIMPIIVPWMWGESLWNLWHYTVIRFCLNLNATWSVNSVAHIWGKKPFNKYVLVLYAIYYMQMCPCLEMFILSYRSITPTDNVGVSVFTLGEGWHNYHHVFPWDYKAAEFGNYRFNFTTALIDFCAYIGLAYDLKTPSVDMVKKRIFRNNEKQHFEMSY
ncbi:hypothetical protein ACFW04_009108 [Cataglyphis niger]